MFNRIAFLTVTALLFTGIVSIAFFSSETANAQSKHIIIIKRGNMTGSSSQNQTGMMMGTNITGSIPIGPTIAKAIASQVHVSLANASTIAEKAIGTNAHSIAVRIGIVHGFLVYMALVHDMNTGTFHGVLVDPSSGKVLASTPFPFRALAMMMGGDNMMGPGMMGPGMARGYP